MKEKVAVLFGGRTIEHEISILTALQAIKAFDTEKYEIIPVYIALSGKWYTGEKLYDRTFYRNFSPEFLNEITLLPDPTIRGFKFLNSKNVLSVDVCFLACHGQFGEDGCLQGLLELADIPYTGSNVNASSLTMNKFHTKSIVQARGITTLPTLLIQKHEATKDLKAVEIKILKHFSFPLFIKPNHLGSSIGISKIKNSTELPKALAKVFQYDDQALVEPCIQKLLELNVAVLESDPLIISHVEIPIATSELLSYEDKYLNQGTKATGSQSLGMAGLSRIIDPQDLDQELKQRVKQEAKEAFHLLNCRGICRFDFMLDLDTQTLYFNEANPIPGSFAYYLFDQCQPRILYPELIERMIRKAIERKAMQRSLNHEFGFHAL